jgi:DNA repair exonuclease SbcCD nuclease subunit
MKLVVASDFHLDHVTLGIARFDEIARAVEESVKAAIESHAERYIFCGDLCDPDKNFSPFRAIKFAQQMALKLQANGISSHWLAGNHDVIEDGSGSTTLTPMQALTTVDPEERGHKIFVHEEPGLTYLPYGLILAAFPFTPISHNYDPTKIAASIHENKTRVIAIGHLSVEGVIPGEETTQMPRGRDVYLPHGMLRQRKAPTLIINGHYHRRQVFEDVIIPGSLARLNFGEERHMPGFMIVEW